MSLRAPRQKPRLVGWVLPSQSWPRAPLQHGKVIGARICATEAVEHTQSPTVRLLSPHATKVGHHFLGTCDVSNTQRKGGGVWTTATHMHLPVAVGHGRLLRTRWHGSRVVKIFISVAHPSAWRWTTLRWAWQSCSLCSSLSLSQLVQLAEVSIPLTSGVVPLFKVDYVRGEQGGQARRRPREQGQAQGLRTHGSLEALSIIAQALDLGQFSLEGGAKLLCKAASISNPTSL